MAAHSTCTEESIFLVHGCLCRCHVLLQLEVYKAYSSHFQVYSTPHTHISYHKYIHHSHNQSRNHVRQFDPPCAHHLHAHWHCLIVYPNRDGVHSANYRITRGNTTPITDHLGLRACICPSGVYSMFSVSAYAKVVPIALYHPRDTSRIRCVQAMSARL